jgi:hypothetical protein
MSPKKLDDWDELPPDPGSTIEALRHLGYEPRSAVADLIDNSITWDSRNITVQAHWAGKDSWCAVVDDGAGMSQERLTDAMRIGSSDPLLTRGDDDLGRFGFGLKTASFSQARELTVLSRTSNRGSCNVRCWDLDEIRRTGKWLIRRSVPEAAQPILKRLDDGNRGTIVLWRKLTDLVDPMAAPNNSDGRRVFNEELDVISRWLGMVFERFISSDQKLTIKMNRVKMSAFDPFLCEHPATQSLPQEKLRLRGYEVEVAPFVLPHESKLTASEQQQAGGPLGWNEQQGFYVYRRDRLIVAGDWLGLGLSRDDRHNLARIRVDVPADLDGEWKLGVKKDSVRPPAALRADLLRIARETRRKAAAVKRHRAGQVVRDPQRKVEYVWRVQAVHNGQRPKINRRHALIAKILKDAGANRRDLADALSLLEETLPMSALPSQEPETPALAGQSVERVFELAESLYTSLLAGGKSRSEAAQRICNTQPFYMYPEILEHYGEING